MSETLRTYIFCPHSKSHHQHVNMITELLETPTGSATRNASNNNVLIVAKIVAMVVLIGVTLLCGALPYILDRYLKWTKQNMGNTRSSVVVQCLLNFGGGVLICTTFVHMLPEVIETVEQLQECDMLAATPFALPQILMCFGFYLMYLIEEIMHSAVNRHQRKLCKKEAAASAAFERGHSIRNSVLLKKGQSDKVAALEVEVIIIATNELDVQDTSECQQKKPQSSSHQHHSHLPISARGSDDVRSSMRGLGIILALSLHELFEGMAIGLESTVSTVWFMFAAVAAHKLVLAFCIGMELLIARTRKLLAIVYIATFSIMTPIGIGIGIGVSQHADADRPSLPSGILQGIACGTLLYVVFFEILSKDHSGWRVYLASLLGFVLMFGLQILGDKAEGKDTFACA